MGGAPVEIPLTQVAAMQVRAGKAVYLSDLVADSYEHTPYVGLSWPLARDVSVAGRTLKLGDVFHDKGLGMHTQSRVAYRWKEPFRWFEATVGLDGNSGQEGRARLAVLLGPKRHELTPDRDLTGKDAPLAVRLDVSGVRELTLLAEFGSRGDIQGHVNWADARLIRE
jgi:hypothetical protein